MVSVAADNPPAELRWKNFSELTEAQPEIEWLWGNRLPQGTVSLLAGTGGVGKSLLVASLELSIVAGLGEFLEQPLGCGPVFHVDTDTEARLQGVHYRSAARGLGLPAGTAGLEGLHYQDWDSPVDTSRSDGTASRFDQLEAEIKRVEPVLVVFDSWATCFPYAKSNSVEDVAMMFGYLKRLAKLGPAVLVIDHLPKPVGGGPALIDRGPAGSHYKVGGCRAVMVLTRVPPRDVAGRDVLKLEQVKNNLGPLLEPVGIDRSFSDGAVYLALTELPEGESGGALGKVLQAARSVLDGVGTLPGAELFRRLVDAANCSERTARRAVKKLVSSGEVIEIAMTGNKQGPKAYKLAGYVEPITPPEPG